MPKPDGLPDCQYRRAERGAICFCAHPANAGKHKSIGVKWAECQTCPLFAAADPHAPRTPHKPAKSRVWKLGDQVESALSSVGVTKERVSAWVGAPCGCAERKAKLNRLSEWAQNAMTVGVESARNALSAIVGDG